MHFIFYNYADFICFIFLLLFFKILQIELGDGVVDRISRLELKMIPFHES